MRLPWSRPVASTCHLLLLTLLAGLVAAHSSIRDPIGTLFTVQNSTIDTFNHRVTAFSDFDLSFVLYDKYQIKLVLEPNHDIIPKAGVVVTYLGADGTISSQKPMDRMAHRIFKGSAWVRWGDETWSRVGWARVSVRRDGQDPEFEGTFTVDHDAHHILTTRNYLQIKHELDPLMTPAESNMVLYRDSDLIKPEVLDFGFSDDFFKRSLELQSPHRLGCPSDELSFNNMQDHPLFGGNRTKSSESYRGLMPSKLLFTRSDTGDGGNSAGVNLANSIGQASGCPDVRRIAQVGVATDCTYTQALGDRDAIEKHVTSQLNQASRVYESTFNISLSLHNLTVSDSACPNTPVAGTEWNQGCSDAVTINDRLNMFSAWRGQHSGDGNSHWTLLSTCNTGAAVGLAWLGQACVDTSSTNGGNGFTGTGQTVAGANVVVRRPGTNEWQIIAHETGHTFGAVHDCDSQTCQDPINVQNQLCCPRTAGSCDADAAYIMNPSTGPSQSNFSPCTLGNICSAIGRNSVKTSCLVANDKIQPIDGIATCGNGIVEEGEDCDCGGEEGCGNNACCDASTCKFTSGAKCDDSNGRCCQNCQLLPAKTICRASNGDCDLQEVCDGSTSTCPANRAVADGKSCKAADGSTLACASGQCTSRSQQCKDVFDYSKSPTSDATCKMATNGSNACLITCQLPGSQNSCQQLHQNYLDGTPCEILGFCGNGQCKNPTSAGAWFSVAWQRYRVWCIVVPIAIILLFLFAYITYRCLSRKEDRKRLAMNEKYGPYGYNEKKSNDDSRSLMGFMLGMIGLQNKPQQVRQPMQQYPTRQSAPQRQPYPAKGMVSRAVSYGPPSQRDSKGTMSSTSSTIYMPNPTMGQHGAWVTYSDGRPVPVRTLSGMSALPMAPTPGPGTARVPSGTFVQMPPPPGQPPMTGVRWLPRVSLPRVWPRRGPTPPSAAPLRSSAVPPQAAPGPLYA